MRIAQISPLFESVPPRNYGGTERVVSYLVEELVRRGHDVTLYASGDSTTSGRLVSGRREALWRDHGGGDPVACHLTMLEALLRRRWSFDIIHFHLEHLPLPLIRHLRLPGVMTLHGRLDLPGLAELFREYREVPLVSISGAQRRPLSRANWLATVHHGLPRELYRPTYERGEYLAFVGRVSPEKGLERAIEIARLARLPLKVAAKVDPQERAYFDRVLTPLMARSPHVEFLGQVGDAEKNDLLGGALALLFPIDWPEPFGLVMIEAMACGTPVVAFPGGSVREVMEDGRTGYVVRDVAGAAGAVDAVRSLDRRLCREVFESRFTADIMAERYLAAFERLMERRSGPYVGVGHGRSHPSEGSDLRPRDILAG